MTNEVNGVDNDEKLKRLGGLGSNQLKGEYAESLTRLQNFIKNKGTEAIDQISLLIEAGLSQASAATTKIAGSNDKIKLQQLVNAVQKLTDSAIGGAPGATVEKNISDFGNALTAMNVEEITKGIASDQQVTKPDKANGSNADNKVIV